MRVQGETGYKGLGTLVLEKRMPVSKKIELFVSLYLPDAGSSYVYRSRKAILLETKIDSQGYADTILVNRHRRFNKHFGMMNLVGMNGELFKVYNVRTMHPFSEYLQNYMYKRTNLPNEEKSETIFGLPDGKKISNKISKSDD